MASRSVRAFSPAVASETVNADAFSSRLASVAAGLVLAGLASGLLWPGRVLGGSSWRCFLPSTLAWAPFCSW